MWNIVKDQERKRKQKTLRDRVRLQHEMIKKQDELILEKNTQEKVMRMCLSSFCSMLMEENEVETNSCLSFL